MFIHRLDAYTNIYPFVDSERDVAFSSRITVFDADIVDDPSQRVEYNLHRWTREEVRQLMAAFEKAFELADAPARDSRKEE